MSDAAAQLLARIRSAREWWLELGDGRAVKWRLPTWEEQTLILRGGRDQYRAIVGLVTDWRGVTERDLDPDAADKPAPWSEELWQALLADRIDWLPALMAAVVEKLAARKQAQEQARGN